jgi:nitronate monooxygenase
MKKTRLCELLGIQYPIVQAPMAGGPTTVDLVVAASDAGALGSFGAAYMSPQQIREACAATRARTDRPFSVNLFAPVPQPPAYDATRTLARLRIYHEELGIAAPFAPVPSDQATQFNAQVDAILECRVPIFSFTFAIPPASTLSRFKAIGAIVIGTATTVDEAVALQDSGVDAICAQGSEAGGHRGTFAVPFERAMIGTMALIPQVVDAVKVPVIASGGIMDGRGIAAALALGAEGVQLGTAFLATTQSGAPSAHKDALSAAKEDATSVTRAFSGRHARGIRNRVIDEFESDPESIAPYPLQNALTRAMRNAAAASGRAEYLSLWAGQALRLARRIDAGELVRQLVRETDQCISALDALR